MTITLKLTAVGNSTGVILPKDVLTKLRVGKGDTLYLTETPDGFAVTPYDETFAEAMEAGRDFMDRHRDALKELAK